MTRDELEADLARLKDMDKPPTVWAVWDLKKLIWLYEQMLKPEPILKEMLEQMDKNLDEALKNR